MNPIFEVYEHGGVFRSSCSCGLIGAPHGSQATAERWQSIHEAGLNHGDWELRRAA